MLARRPRPARLRSLVLAGALLAQLLTGAVAGAAAEIEDPALRTQTALLPNGLTVLTLEDHATPVVSFQMWVRVGSKDESRTTGLAHLFEHMMFKGSKHIAPEEHARLIQARGGRTNAWTSRDFTVYFEDVTSENLPLVIDLEAERVAHLDISEETLASERQVVLEERRMRTEDRPMGRAYEALFALAFSAHSYRWPVIGWRSDVAAATLEECRRFFRNYYSPNNILISIVGDFDTEEALARIRKSFGRLRPAAEIPRNPTLEPEQRGERRASVRFDVRGPILAAAWHAPAAGHPDAEALDVASQILSGGRSSRLYRQLVYEEQQALFAEGGYMELAEAGLFLAVAGVAGVRPDASIERVEELFFDQIARLRDEPVSEAEVEKAKRQLEVSLVSGLATGHALAARIARETATFGRVRPLRERLEAIQSVTAEDVRRVAAAYLVDEKRSVVWVLHPGSSAEEG
jgi:predicted Zn-dependent peptidase